MFLSNGKVPGFSPMYLFELGRVASQFDRVIVLDSEKEEYDDEGFESFEWPYETWYFSWGYEKGQFECDEKCGKCHGCIDERHIIESSSHHNWTFIPEEARTFCFEKYEVHIAGGFDSECLEDWRAVLRALNVPFIDEWDVIYD